MHRAVASTLTGRADHPPGSFLTPQSHCTYNMQRSNPRALPALPVYSVSVLQWLCNADSTSHSPAQRLYRFFTDLFGCLAKGSRAVFQFYPESDDQVTFIMSFATKAGFGGGLCVDYVSVVSPLRGATAT